MKPSDLTEDQRIGKLLNLPPEAVKEDRKRWNNSAMQAVTKDRLEKQIKSRSEELEFVSGDPTATRTLKTVQGEIAAFRLMLAIAAKGEL